MGNLGRLLIISVIALFTLRSSIQAQAVSLQTAKATVVLFTSGSHWHGTGSQLKTILFGKADIVSTGSVFEGKEWIAQFSHSRHLLMQMYPGMHLLSANQTRKHSNQKEAVILNLKPGSVTYLSVTTTTTNYRWGVYQTITSHIGTTTCQECADDHAANKVRAG